MRTLILALAVLGFSLPAVADDDKAQLATEYTKLHLTESAEKEVEQDRFKATLRFEKEGTYTHEIQDEVNRAMQKAVSSAKKVKELKVSTGRYNVNQVWDHKERKNVGYKASQQLILDTTDKTELLELAGELQSQGFLMENLTPYLSRQKQASYRTELIQEALARVQDRAQQIAKTMNKSGVHLSEVMVDSQNTVAPRPMFMARGMAMESAMMDKAAAPVVEADDQLVKINISVVVLLKD